ncbi:15315_t:CDS:10, partial [Racocetra persica]
DHVNEPFSYYPIKKFRRRKSERPGTIDLSNQDLKNSYSVNYIWERDVNLEWSKRIILTDIRFGVDMGTNANYISRKNVKIVYTKDDSIPRSQKRPSKDTTKHKSSSKKSKQNKEKGDKKNSNTIKKLITELKSNTSEQNKITSYQVIVTEDDPQPIDFLNLYTKITSAKSENQKQSQKVIFQYYNFRMAIAKCFKFYYEKSYNINDANSDINKEIKKQLPDGTPETTIRKRKERAQKIFHLFSKWCERRLSGSPVIQGFSLSHETSVGAQLTYLMQKAFRRSSTKPTGTQVAFWVAMCFGKHPQENNQKWKYDQCGQECQQFQSFSCKAIFEEEGSGRKAENIDDGEVDPDYNEDDYSNYDIDPNIELSEEQIPVQSYLKYPDKNSPDDFWVLPSGKSIDIIIPLVICTLVCSPSYLGIIRIGSKIRKPEWIEQKDWDYLNSNVDYPHYDLSTKIEDLFIFPDERGLEIGMVKLSGSYLTNDLPHYLKDHVKGYWGCRDLLNDRGLDDTLKVLEEFKRPHRRNTLLRFQSIALKNYIGDTKSSPQKPTGKKSRIINPAITNKRKASTKDISPLTESHSPEIEHSSTQSEETKFRREPEPETSTTSLPQNIIDDDSVEILDFPGQIAQEKETENITQVIADAIQDTLVYGSADNIDNILSDSNHVIEISATSLRQNSSTVLLLDLAQLFDKATDAEHYTMKANQEETLCWITYGKEFVIQYNDLMKNSNRKIGKKKAKEFDGFSDSNSESSDNEDEDDDL